jgi:hypothetical protein
MEKGNIPSTGSSNGGPRGILVAGFSNEAATAQPAKERALR